MRQVVAINTAEPVKVTQTNVAFRWTYIILPAVVLLITIILAAFFYGKLPAETAYRFSGGVPVRWLNRGDVLAWALGLQLVFVLLSLVLTFFITSTARRMQLAETPMNKRLFAIIGNVVALPQIIIAYATVDIFLYNINNKTLPPLWAFALIVMLAGGVVLAVLFTRAFIQSRKLKTEKIPGSEINVR